MYLKGIVIPILLSFSFTVLSQSSDEFKLVNSVYDEQNPVISPDGKTLYFTRANHPQNAGGEIDLGDIWYSNKMPDGAWSTPLNAKSLNNKGWNGVLGFADGSDIIYLYGHYTARGELAGSQGLSRSIKTTSDWSTPENYAIPYFKNSSKINGGFITEDAGVALFSLQSYNTKGGEDLYICLNKGDGNWSEPTNLGVTINTKFQEFTPFLSSDRKTLYFSSNGREAGTDIYSSQRMDDSWTNWSEPLPLILLNTDGRETGLRIYGQVHIFTSTTNSDGYGDIKVFVDPELEPDPFVKADTLVEESKPIPSIVERKPQFDDRFITLYGNVYSESNNDPVDASITLIDNDEKKIDKITAKMGSYALKIESIGTYRLRVDAPGYVSHQETLELQSDQIKSLEKSISLQPIAVGTKVNLKDVLFKQSRSEFLPASFAELNLVVDFMRENPKVEIRLEGHTDNRGVAKYNLKLSKDRVDAVKAYLVKKGISKKRITGKGFGGSMPLSNSDDPQARIKNRRVEFTIVKN